MSKSGKLWVGAILVLALSAVLVVEWRAQPRRPLSLVDLPPCPSDLDGIMSWYGRHSRKDLVHQGSLVDTAGQALTRLGEPGQKGLITLCSAADEIDRATAAQFLSYFPDPRVEAPLIKLLQDSSSTVRMFAAQSLAEINYEALKPYLSDLASDPEWMVRWLVLSKRTVNEPNESVPSLIEHLSDPSQDVRRCVGIRLKDMTGQDFGYDHAAPEKERNEAAARWLEWWEGGGRLSEDWGVEESNRN